MIARMGHMYSSEVSEDWDWLQYEAGVLGGRREGNGHVEGFDHG